MEERQYKTGYVSGVFEHFTYENVQLLKTCKTWCEKLVVGLVSDDLFLRMENRRAAVTFERRKEFLEALRYVDEVIEVGWENICKQDSVRQIGYDVCFAGVEYGRLYREDRKYLKERGTDIILLASEGLCKDARLLEEALENVCYDRQIILFGTGRYFDVYMERYGEKYFPEYAVDNSKDKWGTRKRGVEIKAPAVLKEVDLRKKFIVLCCKDYAPIADQLRQMGEVDYRSMCCDSELALTDEYAVILKEEKEYLKKAHEILLKLLKEFDRVCRKYGLKYYLICGSLIGAVRHHAFIPWDDDLDVAMTREDFDALKKYVDKEWREGDFKFLDYDQMGNGIFLDFMTRLVYMREEVPNNIFKKAASGMTNGVPNHVSMDIYVLDNASNNETKHKIITTLIRGVYGLGMGHRAFIDYSTYKNESFATRFIVRITSQIGKLLPLSWICRMYETLRKWNSKKECDCYYESNGWTRCFHTKFSKELFGEGTYLEVYGIPIMVPAKYEEFLETHGYHNFMSFPPANIRKPTHSVKSPDIM